MRFALHKDHTTFFVDNKFIELEDLLKPEEAQELVDACESVVKQREEGSRDRKKSYCPKDRAFKKGRNIYFDHGLVKKYICKKRILRIMSQLIDVNPLRLVFDQYFMPSGPRFLNGPLKDKFCFQGIVGAIILCLEGPEEQAKSGLEQIQDSEPELLVAEPELLVLEPESVVETEPKAVVSSEEEGELEEVVIPFYLPKIPGSAIFIGADTQLDGLSALEEATGKYLILGFGQERTFYILNQEDEYTHTLKDCGYGFGDRLREGVHPIVYRKQ